MRIGVPFSIALHVGLAAAGMVVAPTMLRESSPMMILPVELLTIAEVTNVTAAAETESEPVAEEAASTPAPAPEPEAAPEEAPEVVPEAEPEPEAEAETEPEAAPRPRAEPEPKVQSFDDALQGILQSVEKPSRNAAPPADRAAPNLAKVGETPRVGAGDKSAMTITVADFLRDQMLRKGCWTDQDDMPDAKRLRAVIAVRFDRNGRFSDAPRLVEPARPPAGDPPMLTFISRAQAGLAKCNQQGFTVPAEYFAVNPPQWIEIEFLP